MKNVRLPRAGRAQPAPHVAPGAAISHASTRHRARPDQAEVEKPAAAAHGTPPGTAKADEEFAPMPTRRTKDPSPATAGRRDSYDGDTAYRLYLREIGEVALLTIQEEIDLAARIKSGDRK